MRPEPLSMTPQFLDSVHAVVRNVLDAVPALATLSVAVGW